MAAREGLVEHPFTPEAFLAFIARFDDEDLFAALDAAARAALEADLLARLRALPPDGLRDAPADRVRDRAGAPRGA